MTGSGDPFDASVVSSARRYNYWLGGKDHFAADRESGDAVEKRMPTIRLSAMQNRLFLHRVVRFLARREVRQYLDIGTGIPLTPNTHDIAQQVEPTARVVYVDNDPIVLAHARALLTSWPQGTTAYIDADLRRPAEILDDPQLWNTLKRDEPVALLLVAVLHFIRDADDPRAIVDTLIDALPDRSWVVVTHATVEHMPPEQAQALDRVRESQSQFRTGIELATLFDRADLHFLAPGVQSIVRWWPDEQTHPVLEDVACNALVAQVVRRPTSYRG